MQQIQDEANTELQAAAPTPTNNKVSELLYQLATGHAGLLLSYCFDVSLPLQLTTLSSLSLCVQLLVWTDTLGPDDAARIAREQLREVLAGCLGLIHLLIFIYFVPMPAYLRSLAILAVCCVCVAAALPSLPGDAKGLVVRRRTRQSRMDSWAPAKRLYGWFRFWSKNEGESGAVPSYEELRETWRARPTNQ